MFAADQGETEVKGVIQQFQQALERHDVAAIEALVSPDVVVLENGRRNDGWADFRDNHLIPEFKEPTVPSNWEYRESGGRLRIGLGLYQTVIKAIGKNTQICYLSGLVRVRPSQGRAA